MPLPFLRRRYKRYLKYGADIVVGHHSHVVQNYEKFGKKIVFYSLGNFIFDTDYQRVQKYTDYGIWFLKIELKNCKKPQGRDIMIGRFLSLFRFWKFADNETVRYIKEETML